MKTTLIFFLLTLNLLAQGGRNTIGVPRGSATDKFYIYDSDSGKVDVTTKSIIRDTLGIGWVTPEDYGAVGNGVTNDRAAMQNALNSGSPVKLKSGTTYYLGDTITVTGEDVYIESEASNPAKLLFTDASNIHLLGEVDDTTHLKSSSSVNDQFIIVHNADSFTVGNLFTITTDSAHSWAYDENNITGGSRDFRMGEIHKIIKVGNDTLFTEDKIWHSWDMSMVNDSGKIILITEYSPISVIIKNLIIEYATPQLVSGGLFIRYAKDNILSNVRMEDAQQTGIMFHYCYNSRFENGSVEGANATGLGYGLRFENSSVSVITNSTFTRNFKSIESSTSAGDYDYGRFPNRNMIISDNYGSGNGFMQDGTTTIFTNGGRFVNSHSPSENVVVSNNIISNTYSPVVYSGTDLLASGNKIVGNTNIGFSLVYGNNITIQNNTYEAGVANQDTSVTNDTARIMQIFVDVLAMDSSDNGRIVISGNKINNLYKTFINNAGGDTIRNIIISDNIVDFYNSNDDDVYWFNSGTSLYQNLQFMNNIARVIQGNLSLERIPAGFRDDFKALYFDDNIYYSQGLTAILNIPKTDFQRIVTPTTSDSVKLNWFDYDTQVDSIKFKTNDSAYIQIEFGADGNGTTMLSTDSSYYINGEQTRTIFADATMPAGSEAYLHFIAVGDTLSYLDYKLYYHQETDDPSPDTNLVVNGTFDTSTDWTLNAGWAISGGVGVGTTTVATMTQDIGAEIGVTYRVIYTVLNYSSGSVRCGIGGNNGTTRSANGTYVEDIRVTTVGNLFIDGVSAFTGQIDNISVVIK